MIAAILKGAIVVVAGLLVFFAITMTLEYLGFWIEVVL
jgi:hypothetical protein